MLEQNRLSVLVMNEPDLPSKEDTGGEGVRIPVSVFFFSCIIKCYSSKNGSWFQQQL